MVAVKVFVEGGGDNNRALTNECRASFASFIRKAGLVGQMPKIIPCGGRQIAYKRYCIAINNGERAFLLVDSESAVSDASPWQHLLTRKGDNWSCPTGGKDEDCHLMVQVMETWFLCDTDTLKAYYGQGFNENCLPKNNDVEKISKQDIEQALKIATKSTKKGEYSKGAHSFEILAQIDPHKILQQSQWAQRFINALVDKMNQIA
ncbi:MAG: DUF4276 family protein [Deferribacteraceae bacterium]|jgi:hypothetical protein|nr:DUF4276 family protein [Deferribacteraceae bacterium]